MASRAPRKLRWTSASATHVGTVRELNEDSCLDLAERSLWAVADGMGGHEAGDFASKTVLDGLRDIRRTDDLDQDVDDVQTRLQAANARLRAYAGSATRSGIVGATVAIVVASETGFVCLWAGDSRVYLLRDGKLRLMTRDHSHVQELISLGRLDARDARSHPSANVITRAVGAADTLDVDIVPEQARDGDALLICSDGLTNALADDEILALAGQDSCAAAVEDLMRAALDRGAADNVTVIVVHGEAAAS